MRLAAFMKADLSLLLRHGFVAAYAVVGLAYAAIVRALPPEWAAAVLPVLVWSDPVFFGFFFAGATVCLDLAQGTYRALAATPFPLPAYILIKAVDLGILAMLLALGVSFSVPGATFSFAGLLVTVLLGVVPAALFGAAFAFMLKTVNRFLIGAIPFMAFLSLPIIVYAAGAYLPDWVTLAAGLTPGYGAFRWALASYGRAGAGAGSLALGALSTAVWTGIAVIALSGPASSRARENDMNVKDASRIARLAGTDVRMVFRDPLLAILPFVPFLAAGGLRLLLPTVAGFLLKAIQFDLYAYGGLIRVSLMLFPGMFYGMASGFLLLDDRDAGLSSYWSVTPVRRGGYLAARLGTFALAAFPAGLACGYLGGFGETWLPVELGVAAIGAAQAPMFALMLGAFADNKVEGMALVKVLGIVDLAPLGVLLPMSSRFIAWPLPQYWAAAAMLRAERLPAAACLLLGAALSFLWIAACLFRFKARLD